MLNCLDKESPFVKPMVLMIILSSTGLREIELFEVFGGSGVNFKVNKSNIHQLEWSQIRQRTYDVVFRACMSYYIITDAIARDIYTKEFLAERESIQLYCKYLIAYFNTLVYIINIILYNIAT